MTTPRFTILLVEDNLADVRLTQETLKEVGSPCRLEVTRDGLEALEYLRRQGQFQDAPRPDIILLDLNIPKKNGFEVLARVKADENLCRIPVVVLTTSAAESDVAKAYELRANCFVLKPIGLTQVMATIDAVVKFWTTVATLPAEGMQGVLA